jgi:leucokinin receptor
MCLEFRFLVLDSTVKLHPISRPQFQAALLQRWNLPHFMCAFCPFVQVLSVNVSVFTLTAIAVDQKLTILKNFKYENCHKSPGKTRY